MTAELVLLLFFYAVLIIGMFMGKNGLVSTFEASLPRLATRIETNIATGADFWPAEWTESGDNNSLPDHPWSL